MNVASRILLERARKCSGFPVHCTGKSGKPNGPGSQSNCANCGSQTHNYCLKCKQWLCDKISENALKLPDFKTHIVINKGTENEMTCLNNCFLEHHRECQENDLKQFCKDVNRQLSFGHMG